MLNKTEKIKYQIQHIKASIAEYYKLGTVESNQPIIDMLYAKLEKLKQLPIINPITKKEL
jgi:hypothetical protein